MEHSRDVRVVLDEIVHGQLLGERTQMTKEIEPRILDEMHVV